MLTAIPRKMGKPVVTVSLNDIAFTNELLEKAMKTAGITSYNTPEAAVRAMMTLAQYAEIRRRSTNNS